MSSISLYMATVMFAGDWLDATNEKSKQLIPYGERDPFADWQREARHLRRPKGKIFKLKPQNPYIRSSYLLRRHRRCSISVPGAAHNFRCRSHICRKPLSLANLIRTEKSSGEV
jgi:hypothetical protein